MFKTGRWRSDKNKIKAVFKLEFHATKVTKLGWESAMVSLVPLDVGKPTARSEKSTVMEGNCQWRKPIYETIRLMQDPKTGKISEKLYSFIVSTTGSAKAAVIGEVTINFSDYAEVTKPSTVSLPLKASDSGPILHVTIQRVDADVQRSKTREVEGNGEGRVREQEKRTAGQLNNNEEEESRSARTSVNYLNIEDDLSTTYHSEVSSPTTRLIRLLAGSNRNLRKSSSNNTAVKMITDGSPEQSTPKENGMKNYYHHQDFDSFRSPLRSTNTLKKEISNSIDYVPDSRAHQRSPTCLSVASGPEGSSDGSMNSSTETTLGERVRNLEDPLVSDDLLAGHGEVSKLELQTLRRQLVKESKHAQDTAREIRRIKEERDALRRDYEELKGSQKRPGDQTVSGLSHFDGEDPRSLLEEIRQELTHEKNLNANLRLQLEKTQESNSELILAVKDLERVLEQKSKETTSLNCYGALVKTANSDNVSETKSGNSELQSYDCKQQLLETTSEEGSEQHALEELIKGHGAVKVAYSLDQQIIDLNSEIELYRKDFEDLEMKLEQLALDYEILKQENHEITSKLNQYRLQEQLKMQYECSTHTVIITSLEAGIRNLQSELEEQAEVFESDLQTVTRAQIQQEQRAIQAEEALRKTRWENARTAEQLQEEFERLSTQMSSTFQMNEKLAMQALFEANESRSQKCHLEGLLEETTKELASVQDQCHAKVQGLLDVIAFKTEETDKMLLELKQKAKEIQNLKNYNEGREKANTEETLTLKTELERLSRENSLISEELEKKTKRLAELEEMKASAEDTEMSLRDKTLERDELKAELDSMRKAEEKSVKELYDLQHLKDEKEAVIQTLNSELTTLRVQYNDLKNSLLEDEVEKEKLRKQVFHLRGDLRTKEDAITSIEKKLKDSNARFTSSNETTKTTVRYKNNTYSSSPQTAREVANLREKIKILEGKIKLKDATMEESKNSFLAKEMDMLKRIEELQKNTGGYRASLDEGKGQEENVCNRQNEQVSKQERGVSIEDTQLGTFHSQEDTILDGTLNKLNADVKILLKPTTEEQGGNGDGKKIIVSTEGTILEKTKEELALTECDQDSLMEMLTQMSVLRENSKAMEAELKEMQEKYTEISLKFAEVEGERQQLVMTVRTLKNSLKS